MNESEAQDDKAAVPTARQGLLRVRRGTSYQDRLRAYKVKVDGLEAGVVKRNSTVEIALAAGPHVVAMAVDWCGSQPLEITVAEGEAIELECGSSLTGWRIFLAIAYILFLRNDYLWLKMVAETA